MNRRLIFCFGMSASCLAACNGSGTVASVLGRPSAAPSSTPTTQGSPTPSPTPVVSPTATPIPTDTLAPQITGVISYPANINVPAKTSIAITGPTTIVAGGNLELDGTFYVDPGGSLAIFANGRVTIAGSVIYASPLPSAAAMRGGKRRDASPAPTAAPTPVPLTIDAGSITFNGKPFGTFVLLPSQDLAVADSNGAGMLTIAASIALPSAKPGSETDGGSIELGSARAIAATLASAKAAGIQKAATAFANVSVNGFLIAGAGSDGASDVTGLYSTISRTYAFAPDDATGGGAVDVDATNIRIGAGIVVSGGAGGCGGSIGAVSSAAGGQCPVKPPFFSAPLNGVNNGDSGLSIAGATGNGGDGGTVSTSGTLTFGAGAQLVGGGAGGRGTLDNVYPGNGGGGADGGSISINFGANGCQGLINFVAPACARYDFHSPLYQLDGGGNGGPGGNAFGGGKGGTFTLRDDEGEPFKTPAGQFAIVLSNSGNGGTGKNGCRGPTGVAGGTGGRGGSLVSGAVNYSVSSSFAGGPGGSGTPGGAGGDGGSDDLGHKIGANGVAGSPCN